MTLLTRMPRFTGLAALALVSVCPVFGVGKVQAQEGDLAAQELKAALEISRKRSADAEAKNRALTESLAESNRVLDALRAEHEELMLRMASFGVDLLKPDPKSLEQRLLNTLRERDLVEQEKEKLARQLLRLSEVTVNFMQTAVSPDGASRELIERELQAASEILRPATHPAGQASRTLGEGRVVSIDPEIGLVVLNIGTKSGARVGMPLRILRSQTLIGTALVVDVRESITGAVLQQIATEGEDVKVGDRIEPEARQL